jgi:hypothetical protein
MGMTNETIINAAGQTESSYKGVAISALSAAFDAVADKANWKNPIGPVEVLCSDLPTIIKAVEFYAGSPVRAHGESYEGPDGFYRIRITAPGYYACVGA